MKKKDKSIQTILIIAIAAVLIFLVSSGKGIGGVGDVINDVIKEKAKVQCNVIIKDPILGGPSISSYTCSIIGKCWGLTSSYGSLLNNEGNVIIMANDGATATKAYSVGKLGGTKTITLDLCTLSNSGIIKITDEDMNMIDSQDASW